MSKTTSPTIIISTLVLVAGCGSNPTISVSNSAPVNALNTANVAQAGTASNNNQLSIGSTYITRDLSGSSELAPFDVPYEKLPKLKIPGLDSAKKATIQAMPVMDANLSKVELSRRKSAIASKNAEAAFKNLDIAGLRLEESQFNTVFTRINSSSKRPQAFWKQARVWEKEVLQNQTAAYSEAARTADINMRVCGNGILPTNSRGKLENLIKAKPRNQAEMKNWLDEVYRARSPQGAIGQRARLRKDFVVHEETIKSNVSMLAAKYQLSNKQLQGLPVGNVSTKNFKKSSIDNEKIEYLLNAYRSLLLTMRKQENTFDESLRDLKTWPLVKTEYWAKAPNCQKLESTF